jgi:molecular chaperone IbpA
MMTTALDLFNDPFFNTNAFSNFQKAKTVTNYPPYNQIKLNDTEYVLTFALAGFSKDDVSISLDNRTLTIQGDRKEAELPEGAEYLHRGIAARKFTNIFTLPEFVEVVQAEFKDGMLYIGLEKQIPEEKKPKSIKIK